MVAAGKLRDEADGWESQPALDNHTGCRDVQLWQEIIMVETLCLPFGNATGPMSLITVINNR